MSKEKLQLIVEAQGVKATKRQLKELDEDFDFA